MTNNQRPKTIHDFGGFPQALFDMQYPAPGAPDLAQDLIAHVHEVHGVADWGLDHGTWTILHHLYPEATIPVVQLSLNATKSPAWHFAFARQLQYLRERGGTHHGQRQHCAQPVAEHAQVYDRRCYAL